MLLNGNSSAKFRCSVRWRLCAWGLIAAVTLAFSLLMVRPHGAVAETRSGEERIEGAADAPQIYSFVTV